MPLSSATVKNSQPANGELFAIMIIIWIIARKVASEPVSVTPSEIGTELSSVTSSEPASKNIFRQVTASGSAGEVIAYKIYEGGHCGIHPFVGVVKHLTPEFLDRVR